MKRSTFVPQSIFARYIRPKQTNRTCWSIFIRSDEFNWVKHELIVYHERNSLSSLVRFM